MKRFYDRYINGKKLETSLYTLILVFLLIRILYVFHYGPLNNLWSDSLRHWKYGLTAILQDPMSFNDPILFQLYTGILAKLTLKLPVLVNFYTAILAVITPYAWYRFFRELPVSRNTALVGFALVAILPSWLSIYSFFMQETLMLPLLGLALYSTFRCLRKETLTSFALMVFVWALAGLTRGICIPLAGVAVIWVIYYQQNKIQKSLVGVFILAMLLAPLTYRNYQFTNSIAPHGNGMMNMLYAMSGVKKINITYVKDESGNNKKWAWWFISPSMNFKPFTPISDWQSARKSEVRIKIDLNNAKKSWDEAFHQLDFNTEKYLFVLKENLIFLFWGASWPDSMQRDIPSILNWEMRWLWLPLFIVVLVYAQRNWKSLKNEKLLVIMLLTWFIVQALIPLAVNEGRYRKPAEGLMITLGLCLFSVYRRRKLHAAYSSVNKHQE